MKIKLLFLIGSLIMMLTLGSCSSSTSDVETNQTKTTLSKQNLSALQVKSNLRIWVWSELSSEEGNQKTLGHIQDNQVLSKSITQTGRIAVPANADLHLEIDLVDMEIDFNLLVIEWILQPQNEDSRHGRSESWEGQIRSHQFYVDFITDFEILINILQENQVIASRRIEFEVSVPPSIKIAQPTNDVIANYGDTLKMIANAVDGSGNFPMVVWTVETNGVERILGVGNEIETNQLDIGYNKINAYALDLEGSKIQANPVHVIIPYKATKTEIEFPLDGQEFEWNQPILFYARGNELEYSLAFFEDQNHMQFYTKGSGFLLNSLPPGQYTIIFKGKFGEDKHSFTIKDRPQEIAEVTRVEGHVTMSGKKGQWQRIIPGDKIPEGFVVRSVDNGLAEIHLTNGIVYILSQGNAIRILPNGNIAKNLSQEDLALYSLADPESINEVRKKLSPLVSQLKVLLQTHEIVEVEAENKQNILHLLDLIFKGQLKIDEVSVE